jgi:MoxR-like ATPase
VRAVSRDDTTHTQELDLENLDSRPHEAPRLIVAFSWEKPLVPGLRISLDATKEVHLGRGTRRDVRRCGALIDLRLDDDPLSRRHAALRRVPGGWELEDLGSKNGTRVGGDRLVRTILVDGDVIEAGSTMFVFRERTGDDDTVHDAGRYRDLPSDPIAPGVLRTLAFDLENRLADMAQLAPSRLPILVRGETGTGKELVARAIHDLSGRRGPFVAVNCGALPRNLIESELFGYRRGAFSDAREDREGLVRRAHGGTLFLDEVAELPTESQVALLRVLQENEVRPLGAADPVAVDIRVVAATHQDIHLRIADGRFRQDLYARLAGFELTLPPLRDRREDLGLLVPAILRKLGQDAERVTLHPHAARALFTYAYPLNVRELEQALRAAVMLARGGQIRAEDLPRSMRVSRPAGALNLSPEGHLLRERLHKVLSETRGNVAAAGRAFNRSPVQIRRWCQRFAISLDTFRRP